MINSQEKDPFLNHEEWYWECSRLRTQVYVGEFCFAGCLSWVEKNWPEMFQAIVDKEKEIDRLEDARLSTIMMLLQEWRGLILKAEFKCMKANKPQ